MGGKSIGREIYRREIGKRGREKDGGKKIAGKNWRGRESFFGGICFSAGKGNLPVIRREQNKISMYFRRDFTLQQTFSTKRDKVQTFFNKFSS